MLIDEYILKEEKGVNLEPNLIPIRCEKFNPEEEGLLHGGGVY